MTDVVTGEAVALDLPVANFPSRLAALLLDMLAQLALLLIVFIALGTASRSVSRDYVAAEAVAAYVLVIVAYPTTFETLSRGKTLGKLALGIRVVGDDGSPVRFRQALVRALVGAFEIWTFALAPIALISSIISARGKRIGDIFAGTYVIQERAPARQPLPPVFTGVPPPLAGWAQVLQVTRLSDQTAEAASSYLRRFAELSPQARDALGIQLANAVAAEVSPLPPAGTPPTAYLSTVLAVRRAREQASAAWLQGMPPSYMPVPPSYMPGPQSQAPGLGGAVAATGPATTGPGATGSGATGPATTGPATTGPATTGPATTGPAAAEPAAEPAAPEPAAPEPAPAHTPAPDPIEHGLAPPA